jgi:microsomal dipeptidase-like Zn-dependent dipeptidase
VQFQFNPGKVRGLGLAISDKARRESVRNKGNLPPHPIRGVGYCNRLGLTPAGKALINEMMDRHMIIDIDHMSYQAANDVMDLVEQRGNYPVVSGHAGMIETSIGPGKRHEAQKTAEQLRRIAALAGMGSTFAAEGATARRKHGVVEGIVAYGTKVPNDCSNSSKTFAQAYQYEVDQFGGRDRAAVGLGTDMMGAWIQPGPRFGRKGCSRDGRSDAAEKSKQQKGVIYPFRYPGMPFALDKSKINGRTFDINEDGLAHVGMLPDFIADLLADGLTEADLKPLFRSAEGYIQVWEKASGIRRVVGPPTPPLFLEVDRDHMTDSGGVITVHAADWTTGRAVDGWITLDGQPSGRIGQPIEFAYKSDGRPTLGIVWARGYASETFLLSNVSNAGDN